MPETGGVRDVLLVGKRMGAIRELSGFTKGRHKLPDAVGAWGQSFVERMAADNLEAEATELYTNLKANFRYKRKEIQLDLNGPSAVIATKDFDLSVDYAQDIEDPQAYCIHYHITNIRSQEALLDEGVQRILSGHFDEVRFAIMGSLDIEEIIDALEETESDALELSYPPDCSELTITVRGFEWRILIKSHGVSITCEQPGSPTKMLNYLEESQSLLSNNAALSPLLG
jgi:hypothetical protein